MDWFTHKQMELDVERCFNRAHAPNNTYVESGRRYDLWDNDLGPASIRERLREVWITFKQRRARRHLASIIPRSR